MKLIIAFNGLDIAKEIAIAKQLAELADYIEVGSLLIYQHGLSAIQQFKEAISANIVIAETQIASYGTNATKLFTKADADWITVLAGTRKSVIHAVTSTAHDEGKKVILDLIDAAAPGQSALEAKSLGADAIMYHEPLETSDNHIFDEWGMVQGNTDLPIFITTYITRDTIHRIAALKPAGITLGSVVTQAKDPVAEFSYFKEVCATYV